MKWTQVCSPVTRDSCRSSRVEAVCSFVLLGLIPDWEQASKGFMVRCQNGND